MASLSDGAPAVSGQPAMQDIATQFVLAYYNAAASNSETLQEFYSQDSVLTRVDPVLVGTAKESENAAVVGRENIAKSLAGLKNVKVGLESIDCQETVAAGIMIVLSGVFTSQGSNVRAFTQTFILAQEILQGQARYTVRNDFFRFSSESLQAGDGGKTPTANTPSANSSTQTPKAATAETSTTTAVAVAETSTSTAVDETTTTTETVEDKAEAVAEEPAEAETAEVSTDAPAAEAKVEAKNPKDKKTRTRKPKKGKEEKAEAAEVKEEEAAVEAAAGIEATAEATAEDVSFPAPVTNSWAGRLGMKLQDIPLPLQPPPVDEETKGKKAAKKPTTKTAKTAAKTEERKVNGKPEKKEGQSTRPDRSENKRPNFSDDTSVYVANLPKPINIDDVKKLFDSFGTIEEVHPVLGKSFCFVRFESADSVEKVLKAASASPFVLGDTTLTISRKKTIRDRPEGGKGAGRGSFRGEGRGGKGGKGGMARANGKPEAKAAESNDGFTEATRRGNRKRPQNA